MRTPIPTNIVQHRAAGGAAGSLEETNSPSEEFALSSVPQKRSSSWVRANMFTNLNDVNYVTDILERADSEIEDLREDLED